MWLVVGLCGVTCGGKTTLAKSLYQHLIDPMNVNCLHKNIHINCVKVVNQDAYFYPEDSPHHTHLERLNHINWEISTALNMNQMCENIQEILGENNELYTKNDDEDDDDAILDESIVSKTHLNILIIEGITLFNNTYLLELCQLKFHLHLPYEKCFERRSRRTYDPPDITGYFESCVWPMYLKHFNEYKDLNDLIIVNADLPIDKCFNFILNCIKNCLM